MRGGRNSVIAPVGLNGNLQNLEAEAAVLTQDRNLNLEVELTVLSQDYNLWHFSRLVGGHFLGTSWHREKEGVAEHPRATPGRKEEELLYEHASIPPLHNYHAALPSCKQ